MLFTDLPLDHRIQRFIQINNLTAPTEIQQQAIPHALLGKDLIASSKTGSGKTFAFLFPALHRILKNKALSKNDPRVLILAPTRELAKQVFNELRKLLNGMPATAALIVGGENFNDQVKALKRNPMFVVGTPGRVADHLTDRSLFLNGLELLIMDEADRMLDLGFSAQLKQIDQAADHRKRQTLMFSATLDNAELHYLTQSMLKGPKRISIGSATEEHQDIQQTFYFADHFDHKKALLLHLLKDCGNKQAIVFTATREHSESLAALLSEEGMLAIGLSAGLTQGQRNQVMQEFGRNKHQVLVTTDVASRGLDIPNVALVINFDLPKLPDEYVHRIGRTGRAGNKGLAYSLVGPNDYKSFVALEAFLQQTCQFGSVEGLKAKFRGFNTKTKEAKGDGSKAKAAGKAKAAVKPAKRVKTMTGVDIGDAPMMRKRKPIEEEIESDPDVYESDDE